MSNTAAKFEAALDLRNVGYSQPKVKQKMQKGETVGAPVERKDLCKIPTIAVVKRSTGRITTFNNRRRLHFAMNDISQAPALFLPPEFPMKRYRRISGKPKDDSGYQPSTDINVRKQLHLAYLNGRDVIVLSWATREAEEFMEAWCCYNADDFPLEGSDRMPGFQSPGEDGRCYLNLTYDSKPPTTQKVLSQLVIKPQVLVVHQNPLTSTTEVIQAAFEVRSFSPIAEWVSWLGELETRQCFSCDNSYKALERLRPTQTPPPDDSDSKPKSTSTNPNKPGSTTTRGQSNNSSSQSNNRVSGDGGKGSCSTGGAVPGAALEVEEEAGEEESVGELIFEDMWAKEIDMNARYLWTKGTSQLFDPCKMVDSFSRATHVVTNDHQRRNLPTGSIFAASLADMEHYNQQYLAYLEGEGDDSEVGVDIRRICSPALTLCQEEQAEVELPIPQMHITDQSEMSDEAFKFTKNPDLPEFPHSATVTYWLQESGMGKLMLEYYITALRLHTQLALAQIRIRQKQETTESSVETIEKVNALVPYAVNLDGNHIPIPWGAVGLSDEDLDKADAADDDELIYAKFDWQLLISDGLEESAPPPPPASFPILAKKLRTFRYRCLSPKTQSGRPCQRGVAGPGQQCYTHRDTDV
ncbi:hypothetical protein HDV00_009796 [Rhizophlyctis rosea]|nr:hypothetical protein HDV00_009796 [Rhizophlyctis rosea]